MKTWIGVALGGMWIGAGCVLSPQEVGEVEEGTSVGASESGDTDPPAETGPVGDDTTTAGAQTDTGSESEGDDRGSSGTSVEEVCPGWGPSEPSCPQPGTSVSWAEAEFDVQFPDSAPMPWSCTVTSNVEDGDSSNVTLACDGVIDAISLVITTADPHVPIDVVETEAVEFSLALHPEDNDVSRLIQYTLSDADGMVASGSSTADPIDWDYGPFSVALSEMVDCQDDNYGQFDGSCATLPGVVTLSGGEESIDLGPRSSATVSREDVDYAVYADWTGYAPCETCVGSFDGFTFIELALLRQP